MATKRKYGYYLKGNKIAIIEEGLGSGVCSLSGYNTQTACEDAGGTWTENASGIGDGQYKSPVQTITGGLEIQYAYSPTFNLQSTGTEGTDFYRFLGWGSDGSNLLLFTYGASAVADLSSLFAADDWIYISGSGRWSGLHQVSATGGTKGILTLKTRCNLKPSTIDVTGTFATSETFNGDSTAADMDIEAFKDAQAYRSLAYVFVTNAQDAANNGLFSLKSDTTSGEITFNNKFTLDADGDYTTTAANISARSSDEVELYNIFSEQIFVYGSGDNGGIEVLSGASAETFELDISRYQANAIVYYLKAKIAEDAGDMEMREFFMREFKRQLEKGVSALKRGPYIIQGFKEMR